MSVEGEGDGRRRARPSDGARDAKRWRSLLQYVHQLVQLHGLLLAGQAHRRAPRRAVADVEEAVDNKILAQRLVEL